VTFFQPIGAPTPSSRTSKATPTSVISFARASFQKVFPFFLSTSSECFTLVGILICQDRRTKAALRAAMEQEYWEMTEIPPSIFMLIQLVTDVKEVNFGWQAYQTYASCHSGISLFAVPHTSIKSHAALQDVEEDAEQATSTTLADVHLAIIGPPTFPGGNYAFLQMLGAYTKPLIMLFGAQCAHLAHMMQIHQIFHAGVAMYQERISNVQVIHILWLVFIDARTYFSTPHDVMGNPQESRLKYIVGLMEAHPF
jgi:hypothetical protein